MGTRSALMAVALGLLALGSGCMSTDAKKSESKKPDVTQPGVLPPPQETTRPVSPATPGGPVVPASATTPAPVPVPVAPQAATGTGPSISKVTAMMERKVIASEFAVGWQPRIAYLPDPMRSGRMSPGLVGQMFLFGGTKLEFVQADGTLTVDLVDETPRPAGQPAATAERWQFDKNTLRNLQTKDETWGKSYVLFLPWPAYKSDITKVRISARYDPEQGNTLFAQPSPITFDTTPAVWDKSNTSTPINVPLGAIPTGGFPAGGVQHSGGMMQSGAMGAPIPVGGSARTPAQPMMPISSGPQPLMPVPNGVQPLMPIQSGGVQPMMPLPNPMFPIQQGASNLPPANVMPVAPSNNPGIPEGLPPLTITLPAR